MISHDRINMIRPWHFTVLMSLAMGELIAQSSNQTFNVAPGVVIDTIRCERNPGQTYAAYLPKEYTASTKWPVIFFYEPATRGSLPVTLYSSLAEKYRCILIGSNNSRNGPFSASEQAEDAIFKDVSSRFSVEEKGLFISGFSGGARAAVHLALRRKGYAGIIACGAAFPNSEKLTNDFHIPFIELIGHVDFNFVEAIETSKYLTSIQYPHSLILFQGTHDWPPAEIYDQAIFWLLSTRSGAGGFGVDEGMIKANENLIFARVKKQLDSGDIYLAHLSIQQTIKTPTLRTAKIDSLQKAIGANAQLESQGKDFRSSLETEVRLREKFYTQFFRLVGAVNDSVFRETEWLQFIETIRKYKASANTMEAYMGERVYQCMRIACYERFRVQRGDQDHFHTILTLRLLTLLESDEGIYFLLAREYAAMQKKKDALRALTKSVELGLKDKNLILRNKEFSFLADEKKFKDLLSKVELNAAKK